MRQFHFLTQPIPERPSPWQNGKGRGRNINRLSIGYGRRFGPPLRSRLTQRRRPWRWKPWAFGDPDSHRILVTHAGILTSQRSRPIHIDPSPPWERSPTTPLLRSGNPKSEILNPKQYQPADSFAVLAGKNPNVQMTKTIKLFCFEF